MAMADLAEIDFVEYRIKVNATGLLGMTWRISGEAM